MTQTQNKTIDIDSWLKSETDNYIDYIDGVVNEYGFERKQYGIRKVVDQVLFCIETDFEEYAEEYGMEAYECIASQIFDNIDCSECESREQLARYLAHVSLLINVITYECYCKSSKKSEGYHGSGESFINMMETCEGDVDKVFEESICNALKIIRFKNVGKILKTITEYDSDEAISIKTMNYFNTIKHMVIGKICDDE